MTNYANDLMCNLLDESMDDELRQLAEDDKELLELTGISSNGERNLLFYLESFLDDLLSEFGYANLKKEEKDLVIKNAFEILKQKKDVDLFDIRLVVFKLIHKEVFNKKAYPNIVGTERDNMIQERDVEKWVSTLKEIYAAIKQGFGRKEVEDKLMEDWEPMERNEFENWAKYYEGCNHEKYNIKTASPVLIPSFSNDVEEVAEEEVLEDPNAPVLPKKTKTPNDIKRSLVSRLDSASRLLREFASVWPVDVWNRLSQALSDLKREIIPLQSSATITDCIFKTANVWDRNGFKEGAELLKKIAEEPDVANEIEKALTGKEQQKKEKQKSAPQTEAPEMPEMEPAAAEMPEMEMPEMEMPDMEIEDLLAPEQPKQKEPKEETKIEEETIELSEGVDVAEENPFDGQDVNIQDVLDILEPILQQLSEREFVRALSKADMMLDSMSVASHFPELGEAMSKSLEMNIYISSRIEKIINKLKGGIRDEEMGKNKEQKEVPEIEMDELMSPPVEQEMLEIKE